MLFIIFIADLRPDGESNRIVRYADDASLLVPETTDVQINYEFDKVLHGLRRTNSESIWNKGNSLS